MATRRSKASRQPNARVDAARLLCGLLALALHSAHAAEPSQPTTAPTAVNVVDNPLAGARGDDLFLELSINGNPQGLVHFGLRDNALWASAATLRKLGFALPPDASDPVRLASLRGVDVRYDAGLQTVAITASAEAVKLGTTIVDTAPVSTPVASGSPGLLLNYDVYGTKGRRNSSSLNAFTELRAFNGSSVFSNTMLAQATQGEGLGWQHNSVRLDSTWSKSFPDEMLTLRVGDTVTGALAWSRSTRIGGVQLSRNFALQPYRTTTPLPAFLGSAALPSQVELYINGLRQYSGQVPAGPFQLNTVPGINGAGNAQVVLTDT
ncbi:MAG: fimbrial biogenesis outer membrane usher protein, partial [Variovorax sp.]